MTIQANFPAIKPSLMLDFANTKQLDSRITYTRASTASYYDGVTTSKAEENQLTYSNEISTARWTGTALSTTINNSTSPDGTTTATLLTATANADSRLRITTTQAVSTTHTFSVYAKAGATSWLRLRNLGSNDCNGWFNLTTGAVGTVSGGTSAITSVGSGWYRCSITSTSAASIANNLLDMGAPSGDNTAAAAGGETISVWGVQLEARSSVSALTVTTTQAITNYIPKLQSAASGVARFDHNPTTGESLGLLIEESRTNLLTYSSQFDDAAWVKNVATVTANTMVSPDGTLSADILLPDSSSSDVHQFEQFFTFSAIAYTASIYVKPYGYSYCMFGVGGTTGKGKYFDLVNGTVGADWSSAGATGTITSVGNGWFKITIALTASVGLGGLILRVFNSNTFGAFSGNGISGLLVWGAQLETGSFATSYIPTVASQVTRAADAASMTGTNFSTWYNQTQGTFYAHATANGFTTNEMIFSLTDGTLASTIQAYLDTSTQIQTNIWNNGTLYLTNTIGTAFKYALGVETNNCSVTLNAGNVTTDTSVGPPYSYSQLNIGNRNGSLNFNGTIKKLAYYPIRVTNAQLQALTS